MAGFLVGEVAYFLLFEYFSHILPQLWPLLGVIHGLFLCFSSNSQSLLISMFSDLIFSSLCLTSPLLSLHSLFIQYSFDRFNLLIRSAHSLFSVLLSFTGLFFLSLSVPYLFSLAHQFCSLRSSVFPLLDHPCLCFNLYCHQFNFNFKVCFFDFQRLLRSCNVISSLFYLVFFCNAVCFNCFIALRSAFIIISSYFIELCLFLSFIFVVIAFFFLDGTSEVASPARRLLSSTNIWHHRQRSSCTSCNSSNRSSRSRSHGTVILAGFVWQTTTRKEETIRATINTATGKEATGKPGEGAAGTCQLRCASRFPTDCDRLRA